VYGPPRIDFPAVAAHVAGVIAAIAPTDSVERFEALGVTVLRAEARFTGPTEIAAGDQRVRARRFVIATGSQPAAPPVPGLDGVPFFTNETIFGNTMLPRHLAVIGGGPIGLEMAQAHRLLGAEVTVIEAARIAGKDDPELVELLKTRLAADGIALREETEIERVERNGEGVILALAGGERIVASHLLVAAGRTPNVATLDLEKAGVAVDKKGIEVDARLRTTNRRVFAIGDVAGGPQFTHVANHHAGVVLRNALFRLPAKLDYRALPWVTFTDPELAQVGLTEAAARAQHGDGITILRSTFHENDRAQAERATHGLVKVVTTRRGHILGASILGRHAGELIQPWALAIAGEVPIRTIAGMIAPYPTLGEAGKRAAGSFFLPKLFSARTRKIVRLLRWFG
jgi:pyruvate/2-oxoglutarate dehydrogenase complex dihydrolipoamide dehydrogenase (E3) component